MCEFCKSKYDDNELEFCPGCGAKLRKIPDPPRPVVMVQPSPARKTVGAAPLVIRILAAFLMVALAWGITAGLFSSTRKQPDTKPVMANSGASPANICAPEVLFKHGLMPQIAEQIWPGAEIAADLLQQLTYFSIRTSDDSLDVGYGTGDPFAIDFEAQHFSISITDKKDAVIELKPFTGLQKLETSLRLAPSAIETLHGLKYLECQYDAEDLSQTESLPSLESLIINSYSLNSLEGIENLAALKELSLERAKVTDISPLSRCQNLTSLSFNHCGEIQNPNIVGDLGGLTSLSIIDSDSLDFAFIGRLKMLKSLTISNTETKTLAFVGELPNLEYLCLNRNSNAKIMPSFERVSGSLKELVLDASGLDSVDFLSGLTNLEKLEIYNPPSVRPLSGMAKLEELTISPGWSVDTLSPLGNLTALKKLTFAKNMGFTPWNNEVFSFLSSLTGLEELSFAGCGLYFNANSVYSLTNLKSLDFSGNTVCGNFSNIKNLTNLEILRLSKTRLASSFWVESDGFVTSIGINGEQTMDSQASSLAALSGLRELDVSSTDLQDIAFIGNLKNLEYFYASNNYITDVFVLTELPLLKTADLSANAVANWDTLNSINGALIIGKP